MVENNVQKHSGGRPSSYTREIGVKICDLIAHGKTLIHITKLPGMPGRDTIREWGRKNEEFAPMYAKARKDQAEYYTDEILEIADSAYDKDDAYAKRLQIDSRKWYVAKVVPKIAPLAGSYAHQARQIINEYLGGDLDEERAHGLMKLLGEEASFTALDSLGNELKSFRQELFSFKSAPPKVK